MNKEMVERGRLGGLKGGQARKDKLSAERRREIASMGGKARWKKKKGGRHGNRS